ncbi:hypothetical protein KXE51_003447 [Salmonella enterica]|jgi:hypothetical protein|nr:hypothetical protein [Salmonella enterica]
MTDSEVYNASMTYHAKVAKKGCAADKAYWVGELRALRAAVNYQIIMNHDNKGEDREELKVARERLRFGLSKALEYVK